MFRKVEKKGGRDNRKGKERKMGGKGKDELFPRGLGFRIAFCRFCKDKSKIIEYKNISILEKMINERGKILSRRVTGNCAKHQRKVAMSVKRARFLSLIPYTK